MCGICGFTWDDSILVKKMCTTLQHRGPDNKETYTEGNISLGHTRLSIIDLTKSANQPMVWKQYVITYNGELYNYRELRRVLQQKKHKFITDSDTEVILHGYEEWGEKCLHYFEGMWAFAIWDNKKNQLFLTRDCNGIKPLYYYWNNKQLIFASEIKTILCSDEVDRQINSFALQMYYILHYTPTEQTLITNIQKVLPGQYIIYSSGKIVRRTYYTIKTYNNCYSLEENIKKIEKKIIESVKKHLVGDVEVGSYLSGGVDSGLITAIAKKFLGEIKTYTVQFDTGGEQEEAEETARVINTTHKTITVGEKDVIKNLSQMVWQYCDPLAEGGALPTYLLSKYVKKEVKVVLAGEGGDEIFGGYNWYKYLPKLHMLKWFLGKTTKYLPPIKGKETLHNSKSIGSGYVHSVGMFTKKNGTKINETIKIIDEIVAKSKTNCLVKQLQYIDLTTLLPHCYLQKADRMTMAHGIEERVPFIQPDIVEVGLNLSNNQKIGWKKEKIVLRKIAKKWLPKHIIQRKKRGYGTPLIKWIQDGELGEIVNQRLETQEVINKYKNKLWIRKLNSKQAWALYMLERWVEIYIEKGR